MNLYEGFVSKAAEQGLIPALGSFAPGGSTADESSNSEAPQASELQLHSSLLDRTYLHQLAAQTVISNRPFSEAEQFLAELESLSLERLQLDYQSRKQFIETGRDRARDEFEALCSSAAPVNASAISDSERQDTSSSDDKEHDHRSATDPNPPEAGPQPELPGTTAMLPQAHDAKPTRRETELNDELAEAEAERRACSARLSDLDDFGYSPTRCAAMRTFGTLALAGSVVALAILFDSFTSGFALFRDVIDGIRSTFLPAATGSQGVVILGFFEVLLLLVMPVTIGFFLFRTRSLRNSEVRSGVGSRSRTFSVLGIALCSAYVAALLATFSSGETASRLLLDFALALGCVTASASLVFLSVTRSGRAHESATQINPWWKRWERTLLPFAIVIPVAIVALALTASMELWLKLIPAGVLACVLMTGSLPLAYGMRFGDLQVALAGHETRANTLRAEVEKERQLAIQRLTSKQIIDAVERETAALPVVAGWQRTISQIAGTLALGLKGLVRIVDKPAEIPNGVPSPGQLIQSAERSLRWYEAAVMRLENRYGQLGVEHATSWKMAKIELRTAYELCRIGAKARPIPAAMSDPVRF